MAGGIYGQPGDYTITEEEAAANTVVLETVVAQASLRDQFATALNVGFWEGLTKDTNEIIANRTPEEFVDAISVTTPEYAGTMDIIKSNPELLTNFHAAFGNDPTMVEGFITSMGTSEANPEDIEAQLADPANQARLSWLLGRIAQDPADDANFDDFKYIALDPNISTAQKTERMLELGYNPLGEMASGDWMKVITDFLRDPQAFFAQLPALLGMGPEQTAAMAPILNGMGKYFGLVLGPISGEEQGYGGLLADGVEWGQRVATDGAGQKWVDDISGATDAAVDAQLEASQVGAVVPEGAGLQIAMGPAGAGMLSSIQERAAEGTTTVPTPQESYYAPQEPSMYMGLAYGA